MEEKTFVEALYSKYKHHEVQTDPFLQLYVPKARAPGTNVLGDLVVPTELALDGCGITHAGKAGEIASMCCDARLLDLSKNNLSQWSQVFRILEQLPLVSTVNISSNPLHMDTEWQTEATVKFPNVIKLALNSTYVQWPCISSVLQCFPCLEELYLSLNQYKYVGIVGNFPQVKRIHLNNNKITDWNEICKLGLTFTNLESLVLLENPISILGENEALVSSTAHLQYLNLGQCLINRWEEIDKIRHFPMVVDLRLQGIPLLQGLPEKERRQQLIARLPNVSKLNGSKVHDTEREDAERAFIRLFMDQDQKPQRFYELEGKYGKLNPLAEVDLKVKYRVKVTVHCEGKVHDVVLDTKDSFINIKKHLQEIVAIPPSKMSIFYNDIDSPYGLQDLRIMKRPLYTINVKDGDEFHIDRRK